MHKSGIVFAVLAGIFALVAAVFTSKVIQVRNSYTVKNVAYKTKYAELQPKIDTLETKIENSRNELFRARELWGTYWNNVQTEANPGDGTVQINIGTNNGMRDKMVLFGWELVDGVAIFRGSFQVVAANEAGATLKPNWRATPDDTASWKRGIWRWRNEIPSGHQDIADNQLLTLLKHEEVLKTRQRDLASQQDLLKVTGENLKKRDAELLGGEGLTKATSVEVEHREGLVAAIEQVEEDRNLTLRKIDELRRQVRNSQADIERLQSENTEMAQQLPSSTPRSEVTQKK